MAQPAPAAEADRTSFDAYILLSEPLQFNTVEIAQALADDYPALQAEQLFTTVDEEGFACDTAEFVTAPMRVRDGQDDLTVLFVRLPGYGTWDPAAIHPRQMLECPDLKQALSRNQSYICVSVGTTSERLTDRFRAARISSCIAAIFAKLPIALAVYWENGDHFLAPGRVVQMADQAASDDWPVQQWIGQNLARNTAVDPAAAQSCTRGLIAFVDYEISFAAAPVEVADAANMLWAASSMVLAYGNRFKDGDTLGMEGAERDRSYRIRFAPKGFQNSLSDAYVLFHPDAYGDHEEVFGPLSTVPHPDPAQAEVPPNTGFFKRLIRGARPS